MRDVPFTNNYICLPLEWTKWALPDECAHAFPWGQIVVAHSFALPGVLGASRSSSDGDPAAGSLDSSWSEALWLGSSFGCCTLPSCVPHHTMPLFSCTGFSWHQYLLVSNAPSPHLPTHTLPLQISSASVLHVWCASSQTGLQHWILRVCACLDVPS